LFFLCHFFSLFLTQLFTHYFKKKIIQTPRAVIVILEPRFITPVHDYTKRPLQLFWVDGLALKAIAEITSEEEVALLVQVLDTNENENDNENTTTSSSSSSSSNKNANANVPLLAYPLQPPVASISEFKTTPSVHVGYATTWFGLSGAGLYMTKKLITKGRY
jgi:hypothetical protein